MSQANYRTVAGENQVTMVIISQAMFAWSIGQNCSLHSMIEN